MSKFGTFAACLVSVAGVAVMAAPPAVADSSFGDWVSAVCRPGTIFDSTGRMMRSAVESATPAPGLADRTVMQVSGFVRVRRSI